VPVQSTTRIKVMVDLHLSYDGSLLRSMTLESYERSFALCRIDGHLVKDVVFSDRRLVDFLACWGTVSGREDDRSLVQDHIGAVMLQ